MLWIERNFQRVPLISWDELNEQDKHTYDYAGEEGTFFLTTYGEAWNMGDFTVTTDLGYTDQVLDWDGVFPLSFWSAAVIRIDPEDNDYIFFAYLDSPE